MDENITNKVIELKSGKKLLILRQARYKNTTYYYSVVLTDDEEDYTDEFIFLERKEENGKSFVSEVKDEEILKVLLKYIKIEE